MAFTANQFNAFRKHASLQFLSAKAARNEAVHQDVIKAKITEAIRSAFPERVSDENIAWVADQVGTPWGRLSLPTAVSVSEGTAHMQAVDEITGTNAQMANAVKMIFNGTAGGRSAPGATNVNHIHVGGNAQLNLLFETTTRTILGIVNGHMDGKMSPVIAGQAARVTMRRGGATVNLRVIGNQVSRV